MPRQPEPSVYLAYRADQPREPLPQTRLNPNPHPVHNRPSLPKHPQQIAPQPQVKDSNKMGHASPTPPQRDLLAKFQQHSPTFAPPAYHSPPRVQQMPNYYRPEHYQYPSQSPPRTYRLPHPDYQQKIPITPPKAAYAPPRSPGGSSCSGSDESTLIGSPTGKWGANEKFVNYDNDRMAPSRKNGDLEKRYSAAVHASKGIPNDDRLEGKSEWLTKEQSRRKWFTVIITLIVLLALAGAGFAVYWHFFRHSSGSSSTVTQPTVHDFGLGTDGDTEGASTSKQVVQGSSRVRRHLRSKRMTIH